MPVNEPLENGDTLRWQFDWTETSPSVAVVELIAAARNLDPAAMGPPLTDSIEPDALDSFIAENRAESDRRVSFDYQQHVVTVRGNGAVVARPLNTVDPN